MRIPVSVGSRSAPMGHFDPGTGSKVGFALDSLLEESGFEPSVPLSRKFLPGCCRREIPERLAGVPY
jgi:hypothetical protein